VVIFTTSLDAPFSPYTPESMKSKDPKISVFFETQEMMEDILIMLQFNCPDAECAFIGNGWGDLRLHIRATHRNSCGSCPTTVLCIFPISSILFYNDLSIRNKKVFSHEHALYPPGLLPAVLLKEPIDLGGIHPRCGHCGGCFFGDDELYSHMRDNHGGCFVCKRNGIRDQSQQNSIRLARLAPDMPDATRLPYMVWAVWRHNGAHDAIKISCPRT